MWILSCIDDGELQWEIPLPTNKWKEIEQLATRIKRTDQSAFGVTTAYALELLAEVDQLELFTGFGAEFKLENKSHPSPDTSKLQAPVNLLIRAGEVARSLALMARAIQTEELATALHDLQEQAAAVETGQDFLLLLAEMQEFSTAPFPAEAQTELLLVAHQVDGLLVQTLTHIHQMREQL